jgi:epoxyqueuosine reductase QueG
MDARFLEAVLSYKHAGQAAGLGKIGWNGLLIAPGLGPRVRLSACVTEAELPPTSALNMTFKCDKCRLCIEHCPAKAIAEPQSGEQYAVDKFACSTFLTASGLCAECMRVCPAYK